MLLQIQKNSGYFEKIFDCSYEMLCLADSKFCFCICYRTCGIVHRTVPFAPHPVEHDRIFLVEIKLKQTSPQRSAGSRRPGDTLGEHERPACLENCVVGNGVRPVVIAFKERPGSFLCPGVIKKNGKIF
jgi:hypothetical protein